MPLVSEPEYASSTGQSVSLRTEGYAIANNGERVRSTIHLRETVHVLRLIITTPTQQDLRSQELELSLQHAEHIQ